MSNHRVERGRKSAKGVIADFANELLARRNDPDAKEKLLALEAIAYRMGWNDLYNKLRFKSGLHHDDQTKRQPWWID